MRVLVIVKASKDSEAGKMPSQEMLAQMGKFNEDLANAAIYNVSRRRIAPNLEGQAD